MEDKPMILLDNRSPFCCRIMHFIFKNGGYKKFNFVSIHSDESKELLSRYSLSSNDKKLLILVDKGKVYFDSGAILKSVKKLDSFVPIFYWYTVFPGSVKGSEYNKITEFFSSDE